MEPSAQGTRQGGINFVTALEEEVKVLVLRACHCVSSSLPLARVHCTGRASWLYSKVGKSNIVSVINCNKKGLRCREKAPPLPEVCDAGPEIMASGSQARKGRHRKQRVMAPGPT